MRSLVLLLLSAPSSALPGRLTLHFRCLSKASQKAPWPIIMVNAVIRLRIHLKTGYASGVVGMHIVRFAFFFLFFSSCRERKGGKRYADCTLNLPLPSVSFLAGDD